MASDPSVLENVLAILEGLKKTTEGMILHSFIARGLRKFGDTQIESAFLAFADKLLDRYLTTPDADPSTRVRVKLIQQRLRPYLGELQTQVSSQPIIAVNTAIPTEPPHPSTVTAPVTRVVETTPVKEPAAAPVEKKDKPVRRSAFQAFITPEPPPRSAPPPRIEPAPIVEAEPASETLPEQLAREMAQTLTQGQDLDELLRTSLVALGQPADLADTKQLKQQLSRGIEEMIQEHRELENQLANASQELLTMTEDRRALAQALDRARKHSLTDELTGLPNRSAFLRQLNAEIGRARRYGFSLSLALIDIDNLKGLNALHGESAGDSALYTYAHEIMSQFRGYDLVARYGDDEFAVLLPNTQKEGASRALDKVQKRAAGTFIEVNGKTVPLPSFSSVLTLYSHGEAPEALPQRADEALAQAKQRGPAQSVLALPAG
jgi:diguanylate cyclase